MPKPANGIPINSGHALASGLVSCFGLLEGSGNPADSLVAQSGTLVADGTGSCSWSTTSEGASILCDGDTSSGSPGMNGGSILVSGHLPKPGLVASTIAVLMRADGIAASSEVKWVFSFTAGDITQLEFGLWLDNSLFVGWPASYLTLGSVAGLWADGEIILLAFAYDTSVPSRRCTIDGIPIVTSAGAFSTDAGTDDLQLGGRSLGGNHHYSWGGNGVIAYYQWDRALADAELVSLATDPWQIFTTGPEPTYVASQQEFL